MIVGAPEDDSEQAKVGIEKAGAVYRCQTQMPFRCDQIPFDTSGKKFFVSVSNLKIPKDLRPNQLLNICSVVHSSKIAKALVFSIVRSVLQTQWVISIKNCFFFFTLLLHKLPKSRFYTITLSVKNCRTSNFGYSIKS